MGLALVRQDGAIFHTYLVTIVYSRQTRLRQQNIAIKRACSRPKRVTIRDWSRLLSANTGISPGQHGVKSRQELPNPAAAPWQTTWPQN